MKFILITDSFNGTLSSRQIFARVMLKARIVFVSSCDDKLVEELHMIPAHTMEEALTKAKEMVNKEDFKVTVIPDGVSVIVRG